MTNADFNFLAELLWATSIFGVLLLFLHRFFARRERDEAYWLILGVLLVQVGQFPYHTFWATSWFVSATKGRSLWFSDNSQWTNIAVALTIVGLVLHTRAFLKRLIGAWWWLVPSGILVVTGLVGAAAVI